MKRGFVIYSLLIGLVFGVVSCQKDPKPESTKMVTTSVTSVTGNSAVAGGKFDKGIATVSKMGVCWSTTSNPTIADSVAYAEVGSAEFTCVMAGLLDNQKYYVRAFAANNSSVIYGEEISFTTAKKIAISTVSAKDVLGNCAMAGGSIKSEGDTSIKMKGLCWSTKTNPTITDSIVYNENDAKEDFMLWMRNLTPNTKYYFKAFVVNAAGVAYGEEKSFTTLDNPVLKQTETGAVDFVEDVYTIPCTGSILEAVPGLQITGCGFCWGKSHNPTVESSQRIDIDPVQEGDFSASITVENEEGVVYYVRAYVISDNGTAYAEETTFSTWTLPTLTSFSPYSITSNSVSVGAVITFDGAAPIISRGFCITTDEFMLPTIDDKKVEVETSNTIFYDKLEGLTPNTTYYVCAYVKNKVGVAYSNLVSFTTKPE
ncbi:MAG: hypothetical protein MJ198_06035 [Bacteroidales bacterium]|nr:hypothetical protein [Bacteroidales bacterium]